LLIEPLDGRFLDQDRLRHVVGRGGLRAQMMRDAFLGQRITRRRVFLGLLQPGKESIDQGLFFAVHGDLVRLPKCSDLAHSEP
jgi:hypothetical protein